MIKLKVPLAKLGKVHQDKISDGLSLIDYEYVVLKQGVHLCDIQGTLYIDKVWSIKKVDKSDLKLYNIERYCEEVMNVVSAQPVKTSRKRSHNDS